MGLHPSINNENSHSRCQPIINQYESSDAASLPSSPNHRRDTSHPSSLPADNTSGAAANERTPPPENSAWTARGKLLLSFYDVISHAINSPEMSQKCEEIAPTDSSTFGGEYGAEAALIMQNKEKRDAEVRTKTLAVGFLTFATLRTGPMMRRAVGSWMRNAAAASERKGGGYKFDRLPVGTKEYARVAEIEGRAQFVASATGNASGGAKKSKLRQVLRFTFDATFSSALAFLSGTFLFTPRPTAYIEDMSKLPLVEGKSLYAEMVCPPLMSEYRRVLDQYGGRWPIRAPTLDKTADQPTNDRSTTWTQEDESLNVIRTFVTHCSMRSKFERALQEERAGVNQANRDLSAPTRATKWMDGITGKNDGDDKEKRWSRSMKLGTVVVPSPGVPDDVVINVDQDVLVLTEEGRTE